MKTETSHGIKSTDQPARQQINHTNQLQTNIAQPAKQHASESTYHRTFTSKQPEVEPTLYTNLPNGK